MQLRKRTWGGIALGALGMLLTACGAGPIDLTCSGPQDCLESELCHPDEKICVQRCTTLVDCPPNAERCEALSGEEPQRICKCPTKECVGTGDP
ncbi:hypothetical protein ACN28E_11275 [Archangium lansingense]|uniref:hypothetical protein n=1 Tax=Archangium lansingense TaxID=2995310 RepID=UPI003B7F0A53